MTMDQGGKGAVQIGEVLAHKYRVDRVLGVGGMGVVVAATHLQLGQQVALKFILPEVLADPEVVSRFEREARAAVRLKSEHVARIIDVGRLDHGSPYIVMEYLEGQDLAGLLRQHGRLDVATACDFVIQACDAIAEAHALGIVHRDLKPGNLFLASTSHGRQTIKVLDFGISKSGPGAGDASMTRTQAIMGSPGYMSPEQMRSTKNVDGRSDVWSLGVILYELIAGRAPFEADTFTALCVKIAMDPHPPLRALPQALPPGFDAVVNRALEKDVTRRFQSAIELAQALAPYAGTQGRDRAHRLGGASIAPVNAGPAIVVGAAAETTLGAAAGQARSRSAGGPRSWRLAGLAIGALAVIGGVVAIARPRAPVTTLEPVPATASAAATAAPAAPPPAPAPIAVARAVPPPADAGPDAASAALVDAGRDRAVDSGPDDRPLAKPRSKPTPARAELNPYESPD